MSELIRNYGIVGPGKFKGSMRVTKGSLFQGITVGILQISGTHVVFLPGNVSNATTYKYPVRFLPIPGVEHHQIISGDPSVVESIIAGAKQLELEGCRVIVGNCGYFGHFQQEVNEQVDSMVFLSSVIQIPWILTGLKTDQKLLIMCASSKNLDEQLMESCRVPKEDRDRCIIGGMEDYQEFQNILYDKGIINYDRLGEEMLDCISKLLKEHPDIGAILLECTEFPPYAAQIQEMCNLPVFDFITMINFLHNAAAQEPYYGRM